VRQTQWKLWLARLVIGLLAMSTALAILLNWPWAGGR
jgi:hypothetical protein